MVSVSCAYPRWENGSLYRRGVDILTCNSVTFLIPNLSLHYHGRLSQGLLEENLKCCCIFDMEYLQPECCYVEGKCARSNQAIEPVTGKHGY